MVSPRVVSWAAVRDARTVGSLGRKLAEHWAELKVEPLADMRAARWAASWELPKAELLAR